MMDRSVDFSPSLKHKLKKSLICCCFRHHHGTANNPHLQYYNSNRTAAVSDYHHHRRTKSSALQRLESRTASTSNDFPEFKDKFRHLLSRIGTRRRAHSIDFRYDPLSYALNFDEGGSDDHADGDVLEASSRYYAFRKPFSARLPNSPQHSPLRRMPASAPSKTAVNKDMSPFEMEKDEEGMERSSIISSDDGGVVVAVPPTVREIVACN